MGGRVLFDAEVDQPQDHLVVEVALVGPLLLGVVLAVRKHVLPQLPAAPAGQLCCESEKTIPGGLQLQQP